MENVCYTEIIMVGNHILTSFIYIRVCLLNSIHIEALDYKNILSFNRKEFPY